MVFADRVLADGEAQEIEANLTLIGREGVSDMGFGWFQAQSWKRLRR